MFTFSAMLALFRVGKQFRCLRLSWEAWGLHGDQPSCLQYCLTNPESSLNQWLVINIASQMRANGASRIPSDFSKESFQACRLNGAPIDRFFQISSCKWSDDASISAAQTQLYMCPTSKVMIMVPLVEVRRISSAFCWTSSLRQDPP